jgi:hypothetical protein
MTELKEVQREIPLAGVWGCPPAILIPPLLEERGSVGEVNVTRRYSSPGLYFT